MSLCTVTGSAANILGGTVTSGAVNFLLTNYGGSLPRVISTSALVQTFANTTIAANGTFSLALQGNDTIDPSGTLYQVSFVGPQSGQGPFYFDFTGSTANINTMTPAGATSMPVFVNGAIVSNPTAPQTISGQSLTMESNAPFIVAGATSGGVTIASASVGGGQATLPNNTGTVAETNLAQSWTAVQTLGAGNLALNPGPITIASAATAARTATFPDNTGTIAELNLAQSWTAVQTFASGISLGAKIATYNGVATVANGVPSEVAAVDLTGLTAVAAATLFSVVSAGQYKLDWNSKIMVTAATGSTLGPLTIVYTDPDSTLMTLTAAAMIAAGSVATSTTANTVTAVMLGVPMMLNCKAASNVTYSMAYASTATGVMAFNLHMRLSAL